MDMKVELSQFWENLIGTVSNVVSLATSIDSVMKSLDRPKIGTVSIPGGLGVQVLDVEITKALELSEKKLADLYALEQEQVKEQAELEAKIISKEKLRVVLSKLLPFGILAGVGLGLYLLVVK